MGLTWLLLALALGAVEIDPASRIAFTLQTRWGQTLQGRFPRVEGRIEVEADGRQRTRFRLDARAVEILGSARYTSFARGPRFFDVARHPQVEFVSDPYPPHLLHEGGVLDGELRLHGITRRERFVLAPSACTRPGLGCDIVAHGTVQRSDYGLDGWKLALREPVTFDLRMRVQAGEAAH